ncbi:uncharacterized protein LOC120691268 isoform X2 [Panicum virgatum]|uniref:uncharacterized protein LOC120691268 isoform X2 n=1 Tax=Panicum virgatum TaxID=38727 RepID=UPI0019D5AE3D|nr:uncharacterized protein LOC120691268 isoform X2 [Panicum virgatum]
MKQLTDDSAGSGITTQQARAVQLPKHVTPPALTCPSPLGCLPRSAPLLSLVCSGAVQPCHLGASAPTVCRLCRHPPCPSHLPLDDQRSRLAHFLLRMGPLRQPIADVASQLTSGVMLHYRGKAYCQGWLTGEGRATLRQCSSRTGTTRLTDEACDAAAVSSPAQVCSCILSNSITRCLQVSAKIRMNLTTNAADKDSYLMKRNSGYMPCLRNEAEVEEFECVQVQMLFECLRPATIIKPYNHLSFAFWCMIRKAGHR